MSAGARIVGVVFRVLVGFSGGSVIAAAIISGIAGRVGRRLRCWRLGSRGRGLRRSRRIGGFVQITGERPAIFAAEFAPFHDERPGRPERRCSQCAGWPHSGRRQIPLYQEVVRLCRPAHRGGPGVQSSWISCGRCWSGWNRVPRSLAARDPYLAIQFLDISRLERSRGPDRK